MIRVWVTQATPATPAAALSLKAPTTAATHDPSSSDSGSSYRYSSTESETSESESES